MDSIYDGCGIINYDKLDNVDMNHSDVYIVIAMQESLLKGIIKMCNVKECKSK